MLKLAEELIEKIKQSLQPITLKPVYANITFDCDWTCSGTCDGSCQADCTAYQANMPK